MSTLIGIEEEENKPLPDSPLKTVVLSCCKTRYLQNCFAIEGGPSVSGVGEVWRSTNAISVAPICGRPEWASLRAAFMCNNADYPESEASTTATEEPWESAGQCRWTCVKSVGGTQAGGGGRQKQERLRIFLLPPP